MLCCPRRSPRNASSLLPGGERRSPSCVAASNISSLRRAAASIARSLGTVSPRNSVSVRLSLNDRITGGIYNAQHYTSTIANLPALGRPRAVVVRRQPLPAGLDRIGIDQDEGEGAGLGAVVDPGVHR